MNDVIQKIWELSKPYQDKRDDRGHAEIVTRFAREILETEKGNSDVVIPAAMLHDIGWSQISEEKRMQLFTSMPGSPLDKELRHLHQDNGVLLVKEILESVHYPEKLRGEILEIISQHDTRTGFLSLNDGIMRDADKLWMFSRIGLDADLRRRKSLLPNDWITYLHSVITDNKFYTETAPKVAERELKLREIELEKK